MSSLLFFALLGVTHHTSVSSSYSIYPFSIPTTICFLKLGFGRCGLLHNPSSIGFVCWYFKLHNLDDLVRVVVVVLLFSLLLQLLSSFLHIGFGIFGSKGLWVHATDIYLHFSSLDVHWCILIKKWSLVVWWSFILINQKNVCTSFLSNILWSKKKYSSHITGSSLGRCKQLYRARSPQSWGPFFFKYIMHWKYNIYA